MQYLISCVHKDSGLCEFIVDEPNDTAAVWHFEELDARQLTNPRYHEYTDWTLEILPVERRTISQGETEPEKDVRKWKERKSTPPTCATCGTSKMQKDPVRRDSPKDFYCPNCLA